MHDKKTPDQVREEMENKGYILSQPEYEVILEHARRKIDLCGKGEDYLSLLLEDEIKDYFFRNSVNAATMMMAFT